MRTRVAVIVVLALLASAANFLFAPVREGLLLQRGADSAEARRALLRDSAFFDEVSPRGRAALLRGSLWFPGGTSVRVMPRWRRQFERGAVRFGQTYRPAWKGDFVYKRLWAAIQGLIVCVAGGLIWVLIRRERRRLGLEFPHADRRFWLVWRLWMLGMDGVLAGAFVALGIATAGDLFTWFIPFVAGVVLLGCAASGIVSAWILAWHRPELAAATPRLRAVAGAALLFVGVACVLVFSWRWIFWTPAVGLFLVNEMLIWMAFRARWTHLRGLHATFE